MQNKVETERVREPGLIFKVVGKSLFVIYDDGTKDSEEEMCVFEGRLGLDPLKPKSFYEKSYIRGKNKFLFKRNLEIVRAILIRILNNDIKEQHTNVEKVLKQHGAPKSLSGIFVRKLKGLLQEHSVDEFSLTFSEKEINEAVRNTDGKKIKFVETCKKCKKELPYSGRQNFFSSTYSV